MQQRWGAQIASRQNRNGCNGVDGAGEGTGLRSGRVLPRTMLAVALAIAVGQAVADDAAPNAARTLDAVQVTAAVVTDNAVRSKRNAGVTVDSLDENSIQVTSQEDSIAQKLLVAPGVSLMRDEDQPRYVSVRGISPNINSTTIDGITMASVGDEGGGERKINLQMIPNDIADRIDIYKTFSAEQAADGVGASIDLISGSAFDHGRHALHVEGSANYHDLGNDDGTNSMPRTTSRWGGGLKGRYSTVFGNDDQFGITVSLRQQQFQTSQNKLFQTSHHFFDNDGAPISGPLAAQGWNGMVAPNAIAYYADNRWMNSYGGSAKLEWMPRDSPLRASMLVFGYGLEERRTENGFQFVTRQAVEAQTPTSGTKEIQAMEVIFEDRVLSRNNRGILTGLEWSEGDQWLGLRAGYTRDRSHGTSNSVRLRAEPGPGERLHYASSGPGEIFNVVGLDDPGIIGDTPYRLSGAGANRTYATAGLGNVRLDFTRNIGADARGFGVAAGLEHKRLDVNTDHTRRVYQVGGDYSDLLYDPGWRYPHAIDALPFFDTPRFVEGGGWAGLGLNDVATAYQSQASDFRYVEKVRDAYLSLHYSTDMIQAIVGVRYDDTAFKAYTPTIASGVVSGTTTNAGGYDNLLPSFNLVARVRDDINLRLSASRTIGRPIPSNIAQAEVLNCNADTGDCTLSRGNPDLEPLRSRNLDVSVEKYFNGNSGYVSLALFHKAIEDNIVGISEERIDADGLLTTITTPRNLDDSSVRGVELSLVSRDMPLWGQRFDVMFNATRMDGEMTYTWSEGSRRIDQLATQPDKLANLGVTWHVPWRDSRLTVSRNYTGRHIFTIGANEWGNRGFRSRSVTDIAWVTRIDPRWTVGLSAANVFNEDQYQTVGEDYQTMRNLNNYGATYALTLRYELE